MGSVSGCASLGLMMIRSNFGTDKLLDLGALLERIVLGVLENDLEFRIFVSGGPYVRVHLHAPGLA